MLGWTHQGTQIMSFHINCAYSCKRNKSHVNWPSILKQNHYTFPNTWNTQYTITLLVCLKLILFFYEVETNTFLISMFEIDTGNQDMTSILAPKKSNFDPSLWPNIPLQPLEQGI